MWGKLSKLSEMVHSMSLPVHTAHMLPYTEYEIYQEQAPVNIN